MIKKLGGNLTGEQNEYKRKLAYPIGHERFGVYKLMEFDIESQAIKNLESSMRLMPEILRFMVIQKKLKTQAEIEKEGRIKRRIEEKRKEKEKVPALEKPEEAKEEPPKTWKEKKISLEDLDKKLDEILEEDILEK
jgi:ribosomal protein S6